MPKRPTVSHLQILKDVIRKHYSFELTDEYYIILSRKENRSAQLESFFQAAEAEAEAEAGGAAAAAAAGARAGAEAQKYSTRYNKTKTDE